MRKSIAITLGFPQAVNVRAIRLGILSRDRSVQHLGRKFYHFLMGMGCFALYAFLINREQALMLLVGLGGVFVVGDLLRLRSATLNNVVLKYFGGLMRREELKSVSGNSFYVLGLFFVVLLFPKPVVLLSVLFLAIGDPVAAVVGTLYGKHKLIGKKSLEGAAANLVCSGLAAFIFALAYLQMELPRAIFLASIGAIASVVAELCPLPVDDNFTIPAVSATLLALVSVFLPIF